jgi:hypothetical protein
LDDDDDSDGDDDNDSDDDDVVDAGRVGETSGARAARCRCRRGRRVSHHGSYTVRRGSIRWCGGDSVAETTVVAGRGCVGVGSGGGGAGGGAGGGGDDGVCGVN